MPPQAPHHLPSSVLPVPPSWGSALPILPPFTLHDLSWAPYNPWCFLGVPHCLPQLYTTSGQPRAEVLSRVLPLASSCVPRLTPGHVRALIQHAIHPAGLPTEPEIWQQGTGNCCHCFPAAIFLDPWGLLQARWHPRVALLLPPNPLGVCHSGWTLVLKQSREQNTPSSQSPQSAAGRYGLTMSSLGWPIRAPLCIATIYLLADRGSLQSTLQCVDRGPLGCASSTWQAFCFSKNSAFKHLFRGF